MNRDRRNPDGPPPGGDGTRPTRAEIDLDAIAHNVAELRRAAPGSALMAVVKADAYGHGAAPVARAALAAGATWLGVAVIEEAAKLRQSGLDAPVLVLGWLPPDQAETAVAHGVRATVFDPESAAALDARARAAGTTARVHLKVDTGMGRLGVLPVDAVEFARWLRQLPGVELEGVFTHLATADEPDPAYTREQLRRFEAALGALSAAGIRPRLRHAANSAAILAHPQAHYDLVRAGIALYGLAPDPSRPWLADLLPAMALKSRVSQVKALAPGDPVSYGREWIAGGGEVVATIPVGYADGYRRLLSGRGEVLIGGHRCRVAGRVCMDQIVVQAPAGVPVRPGDEVVLLGRQGGQAVTADDWARALGTINYEVVCLVGSRVPRVYHRSGRRVPD